MSNQEALKTSNKPKSEGNGIGSFFSATVILSSIIVSTLVYMFVMGSPSNFEGGDPVLGHPLPGNTLAIIYKGGFIVPILMSIVVIILAFSIAAMALAVSSKEHPPLPGILIFIYLIPPCIF